MPHLPSPSECLLSACDAILHLQPLCGSRASPASSPLNMITLRKTPLCSHLLSTYTSLHSPSQPGTGRNPTLSRGHTGNPGQTREATSTTGEGSPLLIGFHPPAAALPQPPHAMCVREWPGAPYLLPPASRREETHCPSRQLALKCCRYSELPVILGVKSNSVSLLIVLLWLKYR